MSKMYGMTRFDVDLLIFALQPKYSMLISTHSCRNGTKRISIPALFSCWLFPKLLIDYCSPLTLNHSKLFHKSISIRMNSNKHICLEQWMMKSLLIWIVHLPSSIPPFLPHRTAKGADLWVVCCRWSHIKWIKGDCNCSFQLIEESCTLASKRLLNLSLGYPSGIGIWGEKWVAEKRSKVMFVWRAAQWQRRDDLVARCPAIYAIRSCRAPSSWQKKPGECSGRDVVGASHVECVAARSRTEKSIVIVVSVLPW